MRVTFSLFISCRHARTCTHTHTHLQCTHKKRDKGGLSYQNRAAGTGLCKTVHANAHLKICLASVLQRCACGPVPKVHTSICQSEWKVHHARHLPSGNPVLAGLMLSSGCKELGPLVSTEREKERGRERWHHKIWWYMYMYKHIHVDLDKNHQKNKVASVT